jgi:hypothetical protein
VVDVKPIVGTSVVIVVMIALFFSGVMYPPSQANGIARPFDEGVTMKGFLALEPGMSKDDVDRVLNSNAKLVSSVCPQTTYRWEEKGRSISVLFQDDRLAGKWQSGL